MEVKEIIRKKYLEQEEMQFVVESYIKAMKGVDVKINLEAKMPPVGGFKRIILEQQLQMLDAAYNDACSYFFKQGY